LNPFARARPELIDELDRWLTLDHDLAAQMLIGFVRNQIGKVGFKRAVIALSGGIDSALSAVLAARALGPENVTAVMMPYRSSNPDSLGHARLLADGLGIDSQVIEITDLVEPYFSSNPGMSNLRRGNVMARTRMMLVYDMSARNDALVIGTSNKTELLLGYGTLHGDMASAVNPLGDLYKTQVFMLAAAVGVPDPILQKPPSADLWEGQTDEEELGLTYRDVDRLLVLLVDRRFNLQEAASAGVDRGYISQILGKVRTNQFKRRPPVIAKLSDRTIEREFRYPRDWGV
jgi:NAD+ synthase